jgi:hypothetical protein
MQGGMFFLDRAKTGRAAAGTLSPWSERYLSEDIASLGADLLGRQEPAATEDYNPVNVVSVLRVDKARERGRERREQRPTKSVVDPGGKCHDPERKTEILQRFPGGSDGTRTRDLRRDRPTL